MSLKLSPSVRFAVFWFFMSIGRAEHVFLSSVFHPYSRVGNSPLHSTRFNYLRFYGSIFISFALSLVICDYQ